jgi:hypothetical protein
MRAVMGLLGVLIFLAAAAIAFRARGGRQRGTYATLAGAGGIIAIGALVYDDTAVVVLVDAIVVVAVVLMMTSVYRFVVRSRRSNS